MISLTFVRSSNGSHGAVGRTTGFWSARYGFESPNLPKFFIFINMILNYKDCFFHFYQKFYFPPIFSWWFMNWKADLCRYFVFLYYFFQDRNNFVRSSLIVLLAHYFTAWNYSLCQAQRVQAKPKMLQHQQLLENYIYSVLLQIGILNLECTKFSQA